ncbi:MAG: carboxymuconolactone decarboxylase family protein [Acidimicrobiia bacterium]
MTTYDRYAEGMRVRRRVLGDEHVDRAEASATALDADFQRFITETAWGWVWSRPGLDARTRNLITIAVLAALARGELEGSANVLDRFNFAAFSGLPPPSQETGTQPSAHRPSRRMQPLVTGTSRGSTAPLGRLPKSTVLTAGQTRPTRRLSS